MEKKFKNPKTILGLVLAVILLSSLLISNSFFLELRGITVYGADKIIAYAHVTDDVTNLRFRSSMETSNTSNVIAKINGGKTMDVYSCQSDSNNYDWLYVAMDISGEYKFGYVAAEYITIDSYIDDTEEMTDESFEDYLNRQGFPESYKPYLRQLHAKYPKWVFEADKLSTDWTDINVAENRRGYSLIQSSAANSWKSTATGCYEWETGEYVILDSGGWVQASPELVAYAMDPRNFLTSNYIFMFEKLSYSSILQTSDGLASILSGTFMENSDHDLTYEGNSYNYNSALMKAGSSSGVSPYHLASRIIQEQGRDGRGSSISGNVSGYEGYYNYYNQHAFKSGNTSAVVNGLIYAKTYNEASLRPWNTRMKSIIGGAKLLANGYISRGQDTIYYEKFDVVNYSHQYMTNILAARSEGAIAGGAYSESMKKNTALVFKIPVYKNMPEAVCDCPVGNGSANNKLSSLNVTGYSLTPTFNKDITDYQMIVSNSVDSVEIVANAYDSGAVISGMGVKSLVVGNNDFAIDVKAQNGNVRRYSIKIVRQDASSGGGSNAAASDDAISGSGGSSGATDGGNQGSYQYSTSLHINSRNMLSGIGIGTKAGDVLGRFTIKNGYGKVCDSSGNEKTGIIATGDRIELYDNAGNLQNEFRVVIYGDINGDGVVDLLDIVRLKKYIIGQLNLDGPYLEAADANRDGKVDILDVVAIKRHLTGSKYINQ